MGYYASGCGYVKVKPDVNAEELAVKIADMGILTETYLRSSTEIDGQFDLQKWYDAEYVPLLNHIAPSVENGEFWFTGEDDEHWRYVIKDGAVEEESGQVIYPSDRLDSHPVPWARFDVSEKILTGMEEKPEAVEKLLEAFSKQLETDGDVFDGLERLISIYKCADTEYKMMIDGVFVMLCGWSFATLCNMAWTAYEKEVTT